MSDAKPPAVPDNSAAAMLQMVAEFNRILAEQRAREAARVAAQTPAQRAQEARDKAERALQEKTKKFADGIGDLAQHVAKCEAWTTSDFAWLLAGTAPNCLKRGAIFQTDVSAQQRGYEQVLESCVGLSLHPLSGAGKEARFRPADLLRIAREKNLGDHVLLARLLGAIGCAPAIPLLAVLVSAPPPALIAPPTATASAPAGTSPTSRPEKKSFNPEHAKKRRKVQFGDALRPYLTGVEPAPDGRLVLDVQIPDLREELGKIDKFWANANTKTYQRYCREHRPPIELRSGRPAGKPDANLSEQQLV